MNLGGTLLLMLTVRQNLIFGKVDIMLVAIVAADTLPILPLGG
jgi:hypothetical protein